MTRATNLLSLGLLLLPLTITSEGPVVAQAYGFQQCEVDNGPCITVGPYSTLADAYADSKAIKYPFYATEPVDWTELVDGPAGPPSQPSQQTTVINSDVVRIAVDYHAALLLACSDLIHTKEVPAVEQCAKNYVRRILSAEKVRHEAR